MLSDNQRLGYYVEKNRDYYNEIKLYNNPTEDQLHEMGETLYAYLEEIQHGTRYNHEISGIKEACFKLLKEIEFVREGRK